MFILKKKLIISLMMFQQYTKAEVDKAIADAIKALIPAGYELVIKKKTT
jgi:hypothetical protein